MIEATLPLPPELWATVPAPVRAPLLEEWATLRLENAALRAQNVALQERVRDLEARLGRLLRRGRENPEARQRGCAGS